MLRAPPAHLEPLSEGEWNIWSGQVKKRRGVPVTLIIWSGDEEFPSTASLLFDSTCVSHLPPDMIWSTSMMAVEMMLMNTKAYNR